MQNKTFVDPFTTKRSRPLNQRKFPTRHNTNKESFPPSPSKMGTFPYGPHGIIPNGPEGPSGPQFKILFTIL